MYEVFLSKLMSLNRHRRIIEACRKIRRFALASGDKRLGYFTYCSEKHALNELQDWRGFWRVLRASEAAIHGQRFDLERLNWKERGSEICFDYAPILYFRGEFDLGCRLLESALDEAAAQRKNWSFDLLWHVYKPQTKPTSVFEVTLQHYYRALGRDLKSWPLWNPFIDGFDGTLFDKWGMGREALRQDPKLLKPFFIWITKTRRDILFSGTAMGEKDLTQPAKQVEQRQTGILEKLRAITTNPTTIVWEDSLAKHFPEIREAPTLRAFLSRTRRETKN